MVFIAYNRIIPVINRCGYTGINPMKKGTEQQMNNAVVDNFQILDTLCEYDLPVFKYKLTTTEKEIDDVGIVRVFGISIISDNCVSHIEDISTDANAVTMLLEYLKDNRCSPVHLIDAVEDYLC